MKGIEQYKKNIESLTIATKAGKIEWKQQNSTTYYFVGSTAKGERSLVSVQMLEDDYGNNYIQLIITNSVTKETVLTLYSSEEGLEGLLEKLYDEVSYQIEKKGIDYFDDLINNI
jgi:hypothetical protein